MLKRSRSQPTPPASISSSSPAILVIDSTPQGFRLRPPSNSSLAFFSFAFGSFPRLALAGGWGSRGGSEMSSVELLEIDPLELQFPFELKKQISCSLQLANKSDDYVAFKVKTTSPKKYCVRPNAGVVLPRSTCVVIVTMQAQREAPPDMQCKDKFLVQSVIVDQGATTKDIATEMFSKESGNVVDEVKLRVAYVSPPQPPSPVPEGSEEGSSPRPSVSDNGNANASELLAATRAYAEDIQQEKTSENLALISRLTEEKNVAVQQNSKLRQELLKLVHCLIPVVKDNNYCKQACSGTCEARSQQTTRWFLIHICGDHCLAWNFSRVPVEEVTMACSLLWTLKRSDCHIVLGPYRSQN
ncbi:hypothetical protein C4D60_Mb08t10470 [Musa balbisiana]|uniref:MSP domain-containing protein n=1 Tax=Musa balbisiana TaxID=52838 RepID=A0A4S8K2W1_MUSBA|nr:hypothetical protein C4D60_Mb08t10470 [Musa balbisiana]